MFKVDLYKIIDIPQQRDTEERKNTAISSTKTHTHTPTHRHTGFKWLRPEILSNFNYCGYRWWARDQFFTSWQATTWQGFSDCDKAPIFRTWSKSPTATTRQRSKLLHLTARGIHQCGGSESFWLAQKIPVKVLKSKQTSFKVPRSTFVCMKKVMIGIQHFDVLL